MTNCRAEIKSKRLKNVKYTPISSEKTMILRPKMLDIRQPKIAIALTVPTGCKVNLTLHKKSSQKVSHIHRKTLDSMNI